MSVKRKSLAGIGKGVDAFFDKPGETVKQQDDKAVSKYNDKTVKPQNGEAVNKYNNLQVKPQDDFERATFYIRPEQHTKLEEIRIALRHHQAKTNKSELIRMAIDLLAEQSVEGLAKRMGRGK